MRKRKKYFVVILIASLFFTTTADKGKITAFAQDIVPSQNITDNFVYETNEIIVVYKDNASKKVKTKAISSDYKEEILSENCSVVTVKDKEKLEETIDILEKDKDVLYIQPNYKYYALDTSVNDADFSKQWWAYNDGTFKVPKEEEIIIPDFPFFERHEQHFWPYTQNNWIYDWEMETASTPISGIDTNALKAWEKFSTGGRKTIVAVIDTGIDYTHQELSSIMWKNSNETANDGIDNDKNGYIDDVNGWNFYNENNQVYTGKEDDHGTHIAGIIGAKKDNIGIAGIASNANIEIMSLKALGGEDGSGTTESMIRAIQYAKENGAVICNLSVGTEYNDIALKEAIESSNMLFVIAAGNESQNNDQVPIYPASYDLDNIISVANLQFDGTLHSTSNYGGKSVDIAAPGTYIYSTISNNGYTYMSGTSMATPMVTAVAAMVYSYYDKISINGVREVVLRSTAPLSALTGKVTTQGMVDAFAALNQNIEESLLEEEKELEIEKINLNISKKTLKTGKTYQLKVFIEPSEATGFITFQSKNKKVASVGKKTGKITAKKAGKAVILATANNGKTSRCIIKVKK